MIKRWRDRFGDAGGFSLVEVVIGIVILAIALLGLAAAGGVAAKQVYLGRTDMARWAALQQQVENLMARGYGNVTDSSAVVQGYQMSWTVSGTNPQKITLVMERTNAAGQTVQDTVVMNISDPSK